MINYYMLIPETMILMVGILILIMDFFVPEGQKKQLGYLAIGGIIGTILAVMGLIYMKSPLSFSDNPLFIVDSFAIFFKLFFLIIALGIVYCSIGYIETNVGEYYFSLLMAVCGMMVLTSSSDMITIYISLELLSISAYILVASMRCKQGAESALKYILFGATASAILLYGMSLLYGLTGTTEIGTIGNQIKIFGFDRGMVLTMVFILAGLSFKIAMVPFHMWVPETYVGAPTPITAFLATGSKAAGFAIILRIFITCFIPLYSEWMIILIVLAILTMAIGNLSAILQTNIKQLLAYSSIAHVGYILIGLICADIIGISSILFYLVVYSLATFTAFLVVIIFENYAGTNEIEAYEGVWKRQPLLAMSMLMALVSLAGIPPLAGFPGKFYIFASGVNANLILLVIIGVLFSVISVYYYFRVVKVMFINEPSLDAQSIPLSLSSKIILLICCVGLLLLGIFPQPLCTFTINSALTLF